jgi:exopolysaccharide production protein ExoQ
MIFLCQTTFWNTMRYGTLSPMKSPMYGRVAPVSPTQPAAPSTPTSQHQAGPPRGSLLTTILVWVLIVYLTVPLQYFTGDMAGTNEDGGMGAANPLSRIIKLVLLISSVIILLWKSRLALLEMKALNRGYLFFLVLVPTSAIWSIDSGATLNRYVSLLSMASVCVAFTIHGWSRTRFQDVVRPCLTTLIVASIIFGLVNPQYGIEVGDGTLLNSWRGLTSQKNQFGMLSSFGVVFWLHAGLSREKKWVVAAPFIGVCLYAVLLSRSSTSFLATTLSGVFMLLTMTSPPSMKRYMPYIVSTFAALVIIYALAVLKIIPGMDVLLTPITSFSGKDMTFSNRSVIWDIIKEHIDLSPVVGSGYGAYWLGPVPPSPSVVFLTRMGNFYPSQSHNGYLEIVNDLGFVGLICLLSYLFAWVSQSLQLMKFDRPQGCLFLALFFQQLITNLSESTWLAINAAFALALVTLATFALSRSLLERRLQSARGPRRSGAASSRR